MPKITFNQAKEFLNNITSEDKIAIIHHDDGDGFASGILFCEWCEKREAKIENFICSYGNWDEKNNLEKFNKIIITDVAPGGLIEIKFPKGKEIFYTDHHPKKEKIPEEILELRTTDEGYIPSSRTAAELTKIKPWLGLAGTISDAGELHSINKEYIESTLKKYDITLKEFKQNISNTISNTISFFNEKKQEAFEKIKEINSIEEVKKLKKYSDPVEEEIKFQINKIKNNFEKMGNINMTMIDHAKFSLKKTIITKIAMENPGKIFIFFAPKKSNPELLGISSRHDAEEADLPKLLEAGIKNLENANAGGHKRASGGQIQAKDLEKFKQNIRNFIK